MGNNSESGFQLNGLSVDASVFELFTDSFVIDADDLNLSISSLSNNSESGLAIYDINLRKASAFNLSKESTGIEEYSRFAIGVEDINYDINLSIASLNNNSEIGLEINDIALLTTGTFHLSNESTGIEEVSHFIIDSEDMNFNLSRFVSSKDNGLEFRDLDYSTTNTLLNMETKNMQNNEVSSTVIDAANIDIAFESFSLSSNENILEEGTSVETTINFKNLDIAMSGFSTIEFLSNTDETGVDDKESILNRIVKLIGTEHTSVDTIGNSHFRSLDLDSINFKGSGNINILSFEDQKNINAEFEELLADVTLAAEVQTELASGKDIGIEAKLRLGVVAESLKLDAYLSDNEISIKTEYDKIGAEIALSLGAYANNANNASSVFLDTDIALGVSSTKGIFELGLSRADDLGDDAKLELDLINLSTDELAINGGIAAKFQSDDAVGNVIALETDIDAEIALRGINFGFERGESLEFGIKGITTELDADFDFLRQFSSGEETKIRAVTEFGAYVDTEIDVKLFTDRNNKESLISISGFEAGAVADIDLDYLNTTPDGIERNLFVKGDGYGDFSGDLDFDFMANQADINYDLNTMVLDGGLNLELGFNKTDNNSGLGNQYHRSLGLFYTSTGDTKEDIISNINLDTYIRDYMNNEEASEEEKLNESKLKVKSKDKKDKVKEEIRKR